MTRTASGGGALRKQSESERREEASFFVLALRARARGRATERELTEPTVPILVQKQGCILVSRHDESVRHAHENLRLAHLISDLLLSVISLAAIVLVSAVSSSFSAQTYSYEYM